MPRTPNSLQNQNSLIANVLKLLANTAGFQDNFFKLHQYHGLVYREWEAGEDRVGGGVGCGAESQSFHTLEQKK